MTAAVIICAELDLARQVERLTLENEKLHSMLNELTAKDPSVMKELHKGSANTILLSLSY